MNKITIANGKITSNQEGAIEIKENIILLKQDIILYMDVLSSVTTKLIIQVFPNIKVEIIEQQKSKNIAIKYLYEVQPSSALYIKKLVDAESLKEHTTIHLFENARVDYCFSTISDTLLEEQIDVHHLAPNTKSNVICHGAVVNEGNLTFKIIGSIPRGSKNSILNQESRIITQKKERATIQPILYIEEQDVEARHASVIGNFKEEELFYLMSRGIEEEKSIKLLLKSFLQNHVCHDQTEEILNMINKKWR